MPPIGVIMTMMNKKHGEWAEPTELQTILPKINKNITSQTAYYGNKTCMKHSSAKDYDEKLETTDDVKHWINNCLDSGKIVIFDNSMYCYCIISTSKTTFNYLNPHTLDPSNIVKHTKMEDLLKPKCIMLLAFRV